jgi:phosphoesterase RecJ-like protein
VKGSDNLEAIAAALTTASHVTIGSHVDPDGDAMGSCLGLALALDAIGIPNTPVLAEGSEAPATYAFLPGAERFAAPNALSGTDVFVALDSPRTRRLADAEPLALSARTLVMIDHHPDAEPEGHLHLFDSTAAATGCLIWRLLPHMGVTPDARIATCLYAALLTDTGRFSYSNTTPRTLRIAAEMTEAGAHPHDIYTAVYENRSHGAQQLVGLALSRLTLVNGGRVAYSWVTSEDFTRVSARPEEGENLVDSIRALGGVDVVFLAKVSDDAVRASLRSKGDTDVGSVARVFGGGGHRAAAGLTFPGDLDRLLAELLPLLPGGTR